MDRRYWIVGASKITGFRYDEAKVCTLEEAYDVCRHMLSMNKAYNQCMEVYDERNRLLKTYDINQRGEITEIKKIEMIRSRKYIVYHCHDARNHDFIDLETDELNDAQNFAQEMLVEYKDKPTYIFIYNTKDRSFEKEWDITELGVRKMK